MHGDFRPGKLVRNTLLVCLVFFASMMVSSLGLLEGSWWFGLALSAFWFGWVVTTVWGLLAYRRTVIRLDEDGIAKQGIWRTKAIRFVEVVDVNWRIGPAVTLRSSSEKIRVDLDEYVSEHRQRLIHAIHFSTPRAVQRNWPSFCYRIAIPLWKDIDRPPLQENEFLLTRRRYRRIFVPTLLLTMALGVWFSWQLQEVRWLLYPLPFVLLWGLVHVTTPAKGQIVRKTPRDFRFVAELIVVGGGIAAIVCLLEHFQIHLPWFDFWIGATALLGVGLMVMSACRHERRQWRNRQQETQLAADEWERQTVDYFREG
ncbi:MAG: hypothetical protein ABFC77_10565 [Thermoguttaceae bacterium]